MQREVFLQILREVGNEEKGSFSTPTGQHIQVMVSAGDSVVGVEKVTKIDLKEQFIRFHTERNGQYFCAMDAVVMVKLENKAESKESKGTGFVSA